VGWSTPRKEDPSSQHTIKNITIHDPEVQKNRFLFLRLPRGALEPDQASD